uniref:DUF1937 domain-containing protein n=1 Tax=viral metagenome TaxID=1070528 RepID=A0A6M3JS59_9ZZZZ
MTRKPRIYLAVPYTHPNPAWREFRVLAANLAAATLMRAGFVVFSPISHSVSIHDCMNGTNALLDFWLEQDKPFLQACDATVILTLPGWRNSKGVSAEWTLSHIVAHISLEEVYNEDFTELKQILTQH